MKLTKREFDVCRCLVKGMSNVEIAKELYLSKHTIKSYVSQIIANFKVRNRSELAYVLGKENIIEM